MKMNGPTASVVCAERPSSWDAHVVSVGPNENKCETDLAAARSRSARRVRAHLTVWGSPGHSLKLRKASLHSFSVFSTLSPALHSTWFYSDAMRFAARSVIHTARRTWLPVASAKRFYHPAVLPSLISTASPEFKAKSEAMDALISDLEAKLASVRQGGGPKAAERMRSKGKKLPRERCVCAANPSGNGR